jgi:agmatine deiminase
MTPKQLGYRFPAEWEKHKATWLTWPYLNDSFPGKLENIYPSYIQFIKQISTGEKVRINIPEKTYEEKIKNLLARNTVNQNSVDFFVNPSNDVWCRDHGPAFLIKPGDSKNKVVVKWEFNAWGGKYPFALDNQVAKNIADFLDLEIFKPGIIMEGGSVDFNGAGTLLTTTSCLLNKNRNPHLSQNEIEKYLFDFYGVDQVLWLSEGIAGDDTDGHIDDITRFINSDTVITMVESNTNDDNYQPLKQNLQLLKKMRMINGRQINIIELPMPEPVYFKNQRLPASYANFYYTNSAVIMPTFRCNQDDLAMKVLSEVIKNRPVVGIDSTDIIWGYGSFHCLGQQEPDMEASPALK